MCVCVLACVRACMRACVRACVCAFHLLHNDQVYDNVAGHKVDQWSIVVQIHDHLQKGKTMF